MVTDKSTVSDKTWQGLSNVFKMHRILQIISSVLIACALCQSLGYPGLTLSAVTAHEPAGGARGMLYTHCEPIVEPQFLDNKRSGGPKGHKQDSGHS